MRPLVCLAAAGMLVVSASNAFADTVAYGEAFDTLYRIDLADHTATEVGAAGRYGGQLIGNVSGLSETKNGDLYAAAGGLNALARISPDTGAADIVGSFGLTGQGDPTRYDALDLGMTVSCDGTFWLVSAYAGKLWTVDPATGATTLVGSTGHMITGLVARGSLLFGAGGQGDNNFYRIDTATGAATRIGSYGAAAPGWINSVSMSFDENGTLWAALNYIPPAPGSTSVPDWSDLAKINPATGELTIVGPITGPDSLRQIGMRGFTAGPPLCTSGALSATSAPVDSPAWLALLALALAMTAGFAVRRRVLS